MANRVYNFSPGPAVLPLKVLEEAQRDLVSLPKLGVSALEISHRSGWFDEVLATTEANLRKLLTIPKNYRVLFLQGGARLQFAMAPINLLQGGRSADYIVTGSWGRKALEEAKTVGPAQAVFNGKRTNFERLPMPDELDLNARASYVHFTSNETIEGVQFLAEPNVGTVPLVCDASSDFLCRPVPIERYGLIYACAQKNAGPAGVTIVIIRDDLLKRSKDDLPTMLSYRVHAEHKSLYNTPPVFAIYIMQLVTRWLLEDVGGLNKMLKINLQKAEMLYDAIDESGGFYRGHAQKRSRSMMNVTFRLPDEATHEAFLKQAEEKGLSSLAGHRSVGGIRASIYNAMPLAGVEALRNFMLQFMKSGGKPSKKKSTA